MTKDLHRNNRRDDRRKEWIQKKGAWIKKKGE
jgi:hypothetical protein